MEPYEALEKLFGMDNGEWPSFLLKGTRRSLYLRVSAWEGDKRRLIRLTPSNVVEYYAHEAGNLLSGCRTLAGFSGDWRGVDELAKMGLAYFRLIARSALEKAARPYGMTLR